MVWTLLDSIGPHRPELEPGLKPGLFTRGILVIGITSA